MSSESGNQTIEHDEVVLIGNLAFDLSSNVLMEGRRVVPLAPKACELLSVLLRNQGKLLSKADLMEMVWNDAFVEESNLTHHIAALRKALGPNSELIETIPRRGYRFRAIDTQDMVTISVHEKEKITLLEYVDDDPALSRRMPRFTLFLGVSVIIVILLAASAWYLTGSVRGGIESSSSTVVVTVPGNINAMDISPDGKFIAYSWNPDKQRPSIFVQLVGAAEPLRLTNGEYDISPAWSPDGKTVAFLRRNNGRFSIFLIPALGGAERKLCDLYSEHAVGLTWSPNGRSLAVTDLPEPQDKIRGIVMIDAANGERRVITRPTGDSYGDFKPSFSNDSRSIAFSREINATSSIVVYDTVLEKEDQVAQESTFVQSIVWAPNDAELIYSAKRGAVTELFSCPIKGDRVPVKIANLGTQVTRIDSPDGGISIFTLNSIRDMNIWRRVLDDDGALVSEEKLSATPRLEEYPALSNAGDKIAFVSDRSGTDEIWIMNNDGKDAYQLTAFKGPVVISGTWSPDDTKLGCHISLGQDQDIYFLNTTTGNATRLTFGGKHFVRRWSADGRWLYFAKVHDGVSTLQKVNVASGEVVEVAADGANAAAESLDGRYVYFVRASSGGIWRAPTGGGQAELIADSSVFSGISKSNFVENRNGIYLFDNARKSDEVVRYLDLSTGAIRILSKNPIGAGFSFDVSPDGKQILSSRTDYLATEIVRIGR